jgi:hypothetical protein
MDRGSLQKLDSVANASSLSVARSSDLSVASPYGGNSPLNPSVEDLRRQIFLSPHGSEHSLEGGSGSGEAPRARDHRSPVRDEFPSLGVQGVGKVVESEKQNHTRQGDDEDELDDMLEFRFNAEEGIMKFRDSSEDGIPQVLRHSTSTRPSIVLGELDRDALGRSARPALFEQGPKGISGIAGEKTDPTQPSTFSHLSALQNEFADLEAKSPKKHRTEALQSALDKFDSDDEGEGWQDMRTVGSYEVYDEKGKVIVHKAGSEFDNEKEEDTEASGRNKMISASKGYTRRQKH